MQKFLAFTDLVAKAFLALAMVALCVMMLAIVADVFMRYAFNAPITGTIDVVEICLSITIFYSLGAVICGAREIVIDVIDHFVGPSIVKWLARLAGVISTFILMFIFYSMLTPARESYQYAEIRLELQLPVWTVWVVALIGLSGGVLASIANIFRDPARDHQDQQSQADLS